MLESILNLDKSLLLSLNGDMGPAADAFFYAVSGKLIWVPFYLLVLYLIYRRYGWRTMAVSLVFIALAVVVSDQICNLFKDGLKKFRPTHTPDIEAFVHTVNGYRGGLYGTFSAHAATCFSIAYLSSRILKNHIYTIVVYFWAVLVSYSRIYLGVHFPLDILCGAATGILVGWCLFRVFKSNYVNRLYNR